MQTIREVKAYYPSFHLGDEPRAVECTISLVEANEKRYLKTPFAFLNAYSDDEIERQIDGQHYYATAESCGEYLSYQYPWWKIAEPIMNAVCNAREYHGNFGHHAVADKIGVSIDDVMLIARGARRFDIRKVRAAVKALQS